MTIANTILSGLKFAGGGADEHTARVAQAQKNRAQQMSLDAADAQQLTQELFASGVDITSDGRGMSVGALEQLKSDEGRRRMVRLWNSQRAANNWRDSNGNVISTEIVDFARGPNGTVIPMVKGHNGRVVPMTEMRSDSDGDKVLQLTEDRFQQWSNELYTSNLARAGADFVLGGKLGEIDAARGRALGIAGRNGAKNNAAIEGITQMTGGDPEATSAGLAIIADADEEGTSQILGEMGIDPETLGQDFTARAVEAESLPAPTGIEDLPSAPSVKPGRAVDIAAPEIERRGELANNVNANLLDRSNVREQLAEARKMKTNGSAVIKAEKRDRIARLEARDKELTKMIREGEQIRAAVQPEQQTPRGPKPLTDDEQLRAAGVPTDLLGQARSFVNRLGITKEGVELDEARRKAVQDGDMVALDRLVGRSVEDIDPADVQAVLKQSTGPVSPGQVREDINNDAQVGQDELDRTRGSLREAGIEDVRDLRQADVATAMEAARVIAMMTEGSKTDKVNMYGGLLNYIQTGNFDTTPNDIAQTQIDASKEARAIKDLADAPGKEVMETTRGAIQEARGVFTESLYNTDKRGNRGREWAKPTGAAKAAADNLGIYRLDLVAARDDGRISEAQFKQLHRQVLRELSRYIAADVSTRDTSWFNPGSAMNDFFSNARTTANPLEKMVISSRDKNGNPVNVRFKKNNGQFVDGELSVGNMTRSYDDGLSAALIAILEANTERLGGN